MVSTLASLKVCLNEVKDGLNSIFNCLSFPVKNICSNTDYEKVVSPPAQPHAYQTLYLVYNQWHWARNPGSESIATEKRDENSIIPSASGQAIEDYCTNTEKGICFPSHALMYNKGTLKEKVRVPLLSDRKAKTHKRDIASYHVSVVMQYSVGSQNPVPEYSTDVKVRSSHYFASVSAP